MIFIFLFYTRGLLAYNVKNYEKFPQESEAEKFSKQPRFNSSCDTESFIAATYREDRVSTEN